MNNFEGEVQFVFGFQDSLGWIGYKDYEFNSTKNRFGNRAYYVGNHQQIISCLDPGDNRPNLNPTADRFNVQGPGSRC
jgi:hypothetical protein